MGIASSKPNATSNTNSPNFKNIEKQRPQKTKRTNKRNLSTDSKSSTCSSPTHNYLTDELALDLNSMEIEDNGGGNNITTPNSSHRGHCKHSSLNSENNNSNNDTLNNNYNNNNNNCNNHNNNEYEENDIVSTSSLNNSSGNDDDDEINSNSNNSSINNSSSNDQHTNNNNNNNHNNNHNSNHNNNKHQKKISNKNNKKENRSSKDSSSDLKKYSFDNESTKSNSTLSLYSNISTLQSIANHSIQDASIVCENCNHHMTKQIHLLSLSVEPTSASSLDLHKNLSITLASASRSSSPATVLQNHNSKQFLVNSNINIINTPNNSIILNINNNSNSNGNSNNNISSNKLNNDNISNNSRNNNENDNIPDPSWSNYNSDNFNNSNNNSSFNTFLSMSALSLPQYQQTSQQSSQPPSQSSTLQSQQIHAFQPISSQPPQQSQQLPLQNNQLNVLASSLGSTSDLFNKSLISSFLNNQGLLNNNTQYNNNNPFENSYKNMSVSSGTINTLLNNNNNNNNAFSNSIRISRIQNEEDEVKNIKNDEEEEEEEENDQEYEYEEINNSKKNNSTNNDNTNNNNNNSKIKNSNNNNFNSFMNSSGNNVNNNVLFNYDDSNINSFLSNSNSSFSVIKDTSYDAKEMTYSIAISNSELNSMIAESLNRSSASNSIIRSSNNGTNNNNNSNTSNESYSSVHSKKEDSKDITFLVSDNPDSVKEKSNVSNTSSIISASNLNKHLAPAMARPRGRSISDSLFMSPSNKESLNDIQKAIENEKMKKNKFEELKSILGDREDIIDIADIQFIQKVGEGAFSEVWEGWWRNIHVAIKKLKIIGDEEQFKERFIREVQNLKNSNHQNIVMFIGACYKPACIITEYMSGGSLYNILHNPNTPKVKYSFPLVLKMATDMALGLLHLHSIQIVHRDLTSQNILLDEFGNIKISDFGLSREKSREGSMTMTNGGICNPRWRPPEITKNLGHYSEKVDVYCFSLVVWEILTGEIPFSDLDGSQASAQVAYAGLRPQIPEFCDPELRNLLQSCWEADPNDRPSFSFIVQKLKDIAWNNPIGFVSDSYYQYSEPCTPRSNLVLSNQSSNSSHSNVSLSPTKL